jgi:hypothetical protein
VHLIKAALLCVVLATAVSCGAALARPPSEFPYHDDISFRGFAEEALVGHGTPRTHRFDDYTKGSYHVRPREVAEGLFRIAPTYSLNLKAVAVVGSYGPLWAYDVIAVIAEPNCTRVNWLVMPHARITVKRSGCAAPEAVSTFLADLRAAWARVSRPPRRDSASLVQGSLRRAARRAGRLTSVCSRRRPVRS